MVGGKTEAGGDKKMSNYINAPQWARDCGVCRQRVHQVLERELPAGVERIRRANSWTYRIPRGTPWPKSRNHMALRTPPGYLTVGQWAQKVGKMPRAALAMFRAHGAPKGTLRDGRYYLIPGLAEWTYPRPGQYGRAGKPGRF